MTKPVPSTTHYAAKIISDEENIPIDIVKKIIERFFDKVILCLQREIPFQITGLGKFYYIYRNNSCLRSKIRAIDLYKDKVHRELRFRLSPNIESSINGWVHDLGMKTNLAKDTVKLQIKPDEILKIRRTKLLEDQRSMGFNAELLFDDNDVPEHDRNQIDKYPSLSVEEMLDRLGSNIELKR